MVAYSISSKKILNSHDTIVYRINPNRIPFKKWFIRFQLSNPNTKPLSIFSLEGAPFSFPPICSTSWLLLSPTKKTFFH